MKIIDIIILSFAKEAKHFNLTLNCINSLRESKHSSRFNIIVVESVPTIDYELMFNDVKTVHLNKEFNYNEFANEAIKLSENELIGIFNNDIIFDENWFDEIIKQEIGDVYSCSPISLTSASQREFAHLKEPVEGYEIARHLSGWAIVFTRELWLKIGGLSEIVNFWCSDDVYAKQLQAHGIKHYLIPTSIVNHVDNGSNTLKTLDTNTKEGLTYGQARIYNTHFNENKFGLNNK